MDPEAGGFYHCMSRVAGGEFIFEVRSGRCPVAGKFVELMKKLEAFHEMRVVTYAVMSNHFHVLVREPERRRTEIGDEELVEKVRLLNGEMAARELSQRLRMLGGENGSERAVAEVKQRYLDRMGDVSVFMKELKGRFAQWYNRRKGRYGVLWADRFKSVLVESGSAVRTMAAYIDLNAVRAGLVEDPKDYRWCGYGAACGGDAPTRERLMEVLCDGVGMDEWKAFSRSYRKLLFAAGERRQSADGETRRGGIAPERVREVLEGNGELTIGELVRCRVRYFTDGVALGSERFVEEVFESNREKFGVKRRSGARKLAGGDFQGLRTMRDLRLTPIG